ncbi:MAG: hypothetical protein HRT52_11660 [Colwellia sp.]|nr:hypothetical protein [Colwellia sp.]NQZ81662.1 hypothetical protein [Colwellia sp.]
MQVALQFPIADARPFSSTTNLRLPLPDFPEPITEINPQFVHYFGKACERIDEPDEAWPDEIKYVRANRALKFDKLESRYCGFPSSKSQPKCTYRRLLSDGSAVVRAEVGFRLINSVKNKKYSLKEVLSIISDIAEIPCIVPSPGNIDKIRPILAQGINLTKLYSFASSKRSAEKEPVNFNLVESGSPLIIVELKANEVNVDIWTKYSNRAIKVESKNVNGANVLFCRFGTKVGIVSTWILEKGSASNEQLRSIRVCLTRIHAEREVLDLILKQIHRGNILNPSDEESINRLDEYFNKRLNIIKREMWGGMKQSAIVNAIDATHDVVRSAIQAQLVARYEGGRRQVWNKINNYQEDRQSSKIYKTIFIENGGIMTDKNITVGGTGNIVNIAEYMSNVTNTVNNNMSSPNGEEDIKQMIIQLTKEIEDISSIADASQIEIMGKNLEALSKESVSVQPEKRWYEFSITGIKEAAQAVGSIANPIIETLKKLSTLVLT